MEGGRVRMWKWVPFVAVASLALLLWALAGPLETPFARSDVVSRLEAQLQVLNAKVC